MKNSKDYKRVLNSWGNYLKIKSRTHVMINNELPVSLKNKKYIVFGNGRSYGDCALNENTLHVNELNKLLSFDEQKGVLYCQSGVLLSDIIKKIVPKKWFLPVTPGTKFITIGGAVAADVHGKNHHKSGCFTEYVTSLHLLLPDGRLITCSKTENETLFKATCGGMGLTGVIVAVTLQLKKIQSSSIEQKTIATMNLRDTFEVFEKYENATYLVTWIDSLSKGKYLGKGISFIGEHANDNQFDIRLPKRIKIPKIFPSFILNPKTIKIYNKRYFSKNRGFSGKIPLDQFFYPLDSIKNWNRIYGKNGFVQYQIVIPKKEGYQGILTILEKIEESKHVSYLTILKLLGKENENYLSFPLEGYTLAMDFKVKKGLWTFLDDLDDIVSVYNGRAYLAKDGRMNKDFFESGYPKLTAFKKVRKEFGLECLESLQSKRLGL